MIYTLACHERGYQLSVYETFASILTLLPGAPYAYRHWQLAQQYDSKHYFAHRVFIHRTIMVLEALPVLGGLVALIERIVAFTYNKYFNSPTETLESSFRPSPLNKKEAELKMFKNAQKAIKEHTPKKIRDLKKSEEDSVECNSPYASVEEALPCSIEGLLKKSQTSTSLRFEFSSGQRQGSRETMEDYGFYQETDQGIITGILDGHGGKEVAEAAAKMFNDKFFDRLKEGGGNVHLTFEVLIDEVHQEVIKKPEWNTTGSTVVLCFIDKKTNLIYTATLGDSEANIYRKIGDGMKSIPLSCIRDWSSKKDRERVKETNPQDVAQWEENKGNPKALYLHSQTGEGLNVSRSIGDAIFEGTADKPAVVHKPKITIGLVEKGDIIIIASDGLRESEQTSEDKIVEKIKQVQGDKFFLGTQLAHFATKYSGDNVTVISIKAN